MAALTTFFPEKAFRDDRKYESTDTSLRSHDIRINQAAKSSIKAPAPSGMNDAPPRSNLMSSSGSQPRVQNQKTYNSNVAKLTTFFSEKAFRDNRKFEPKLPACTDTSLRWHEIRNPLHAKSTIKATWSRSHCSQNIHVANQWISRYPVANSTDMAISSAGFTHGTHIIEISWAPQQRGSHAVIGVAIENAQKNAPVYTNLLGSDHKSCGWDLVKQQTLTCHQPPKNYPQHKIPLQFIEKIRCVVNMSQGVLGFEANGRYLGDALEGLAGKTNHIAVSTVWGNAKIGIQYIAGVDESTALSLQNLCKQKIRGQLNTASEINRLPLPRRLKEWLIV